MDTTDSLIEAVFCCWISSPIAEILFDCVISWMLVRGYLSNNLIVGILLAANYIFSVCFVCLCYRKMIWKEISELIKKKKKWLIIIPVFFITVRGGFFIDDGFLSGTEKFAGWGLFKYHDELILNLRMYFSAPILEGFFYRFFLIGKFRGEKSMRKAIYPFDFNSLLLNCLVHFFSAIVYAFFHIGMRNQYSLVGMLTFFMVGILLGLIYDFSDLLIISILCHLFYDLLTPVTLPFMWTFRQSRIY